MVCSLGLSEGGSVHVGAWITIADIGMGFLPKMRKQLFEPFHTSKGDRDGAGALDLERDRR